MANSVNENYWEKKKIPKTKNNNEKFSVTHRRNPKRTQK